MGCCRVIVDQRTSGNCRVDSLRFSEPASPESLATFSTNRLDLSFSSRKYISTNDPQTNSTLVSIGFQYFIEIYAAAKFRFAGGQISLDRP